MFRFADGPGRTFSVPVRIGERRYRPDRGRRLGNGRDIAVAGAFLVALSFGFSFPAPSLGADSLPADHDVSSSASDEVEGPPRVSKKGVTVELHVSPVQGGAAEGLMEGSDALIRFRIVDSSGGPIPGLYPAAWIDLRKSRSVPDTPGESEPVSCRDKIQSFLQGGLAFRPDLDLNTYYLLTLNDKASITVIDPHVDFSITKTVALVRLESPGEDWVVGREAKRIFVSMPASDRLAVVDTSTWTVERNVEVPPRPMRVALQPDEAYVWVASDGREDPESFSGVSVVDVRSGGIVARIPTGAGHHEMAFSRNSRYVLVTNAEGGSVSVIDVRKLEKVKDLATGSEPSGIAYSSVGDAFYIAHRKSGDVAVVEGRHHDIVARIAVGMGSEGIAFEPDGRWAFVTNPATDTVSIIDASDNRVRHTVDAGADPDSVAFTPGFAYIRALGSENVAMLGLAEIGKPGDVPVLSFPAGQTPPGESSHRALAPVIVPTPEENTVVVANPSDQTLYYYMEGMVAPMGSFQSFGRVPKAVMVIDRSLRVAAPGEYATTVKLPRAGSYDVAFLLDAPFMYHCFSLEIPENPELRKSLGGSLNVRASLVGDGLVAGKDTLLRLRVTDKRTGEPKEGVKDLRVLYFLVPGIWQHRVWAREVGGGVYEAELSPPRDGVYYVYVESRTGGLRDEEAERLVLVARKPEGREDPSGTGSSAGGPVQGRSEASGEEGEGK